MKTLEIILKIISYSLVLSFFIWSVIMVGNGLHYMKIQKLRCVQVNENVCIKEPCPECNPCRSIFDIEAEPLELTE